jgi:Tol biopolymer transport system component
MRVGALVAAVAAVGVFAGSASSSPPASHGKLVAVGTPLDAIDSAQAGLYVMNADGSDRQQLTHNQSDEKPHWSPDGKQIAFLRGGPGLTELLMVMRADGTSPRSLGVANQDSLETTTPWSRDGKQIAWGGCGGLCVYSFTLSRRTHILLGQEDSLGFAWAPNGRALAAVDSEGRLVLVSTADRIVRVIAPAGVYPAWSPDGSKIAFLAGKPYTAHTLKVVCAAGGRPRVIARDAQNQIPAWAPEGRRLLYSELRRHPSLASISTVNIATHMTTRVDEPNFGFARWSPDGATIIFGRQPVTTGIAQDLWVVHPDGNGRHQLTGEYPTGLGFESLDSTTGRVPTVATSPPPQLLELAASAELQFEYLLGELGRAPTPDSVVYQGEVGCGDPNAEVFAATLNVWTPASGATATTTTPCLDFNVYGSAVSPDLDAWLTQADLNGNVTLGVMRPGTNEAPPLASWTSGEESRDIGWRADIESLVSDGSTVVFETGVNDTVQLWRVADGAVPHALPIPLPADAGATLEAADARILISTTGGFAVLTADGSLLSHIAAPRHETVQIGGGLVGIAAASRLRAYTADSGTLLYDLPLAHLSGVPRLLTISARYAVYESGIELHLLRLADGYDRIIDLPGQAGRLQALLTSDGLFVAYYRGYDPTPARILFAPAANLP